MYVRAINKTEAMNLREQEKHMEGFGGRKVGGWCNCNLKKKIIKIHLEQSQSQDSYYYPMFTGPCLFLVRNYLDSCFPALDHSVARWK